MSLKLYYHPLSSFCHKVLIALYENGVPFEPVLVDLSSEESSAAFKKIWPIGKFPVLRDEAKGLTIPESSVIIEYVDTHYPKGARLVPQEAEAAWRTRLEDRFYDLHVHMPMQKIITDRLRPSGQNDSFGVQEATQQILTAYRLIDAGIAGKQWAMGDDFSMADCAAAPALFYGSMAVPFGAHKNLAAYLERLKARPSYARVLKEAEPYFKYIPR
ncbi:MAG TPA: glutathione S-transferase family protein [Micropepsaceae bacterium]